MSEGYSVVFTGELLEGFDPSRASAGLAKVFRIDEARAAAIVEGGERVIKSGLDEARAARYVDVLTHVGMAVRRVDPELEPDPAMETMVIQAPAEAASPPVEESAAVADEGPAEHPFHFTGKAGEYFRIWIVNVALTILTLGIYSAWAKVRNNRYFYGNTHVAGGSFEYLAEPLAILKGRIVAVVLFVIYVLASNSASPLAAAALLLLAAVFPWLIARSLAFRNRNTALRNIRFGFDGGYLGALKAFILWPLAGGITFGLLLPVALREQDRYMVGNARYGTTPFEFDVGVGGYYRIFGGLILLFFGGMAVLFLFSTAVGFSLSAAAGTPAEASPLGALASIIVFLSVMLLYIAAFAYFAARRNNLVYNGARFADHGFSATMTPVKLGWIQVTNWLATILTLGLARPWARVRLARYKAACLTLAAAGGLDAFVAAEERNVNAMGEEMGEAFDFDIGL